MDKIEEPDGYTGSLCPECGEGVSVDEEGLCVGCGNTAVGRGIEEIFKERRELKTKLENAVTMLAVVEEMLAERDGEIAEMGIEGNG